MRLRIKDLATKVGSGVTPKGGASVYQDNGIPLFRSQNVTNDGFLLDDIAYISEEIHKSMIGTRLMPNDVLLNITGASIGRCYYLPKNFKEGNVNQHVCIIRPKVNVVIPAFLYYNLISAVGQQMIDVCQTGANREGLTKEDICNFEFDIPSLADQQRMVTYLDTKLSEIDHQVSLLTSKRDAYLRMKKSIINHAVTRGLNPNVKMKDSGIEWIGEVPGHWEVKRLKNVVECNAKSLGENTPKDSFIKYVEISDVDNVHGINNIQSLMFGEAPSRARRITQKGDIIISTVRTYLKAIAKIEDDDIIVSTGFAVLHPTKCNGEYLAYYILSESFINKVEMLSKETSYPAINASDLVSINVLIPPLPEQHAIATYLDDKCAKIDTIVSNLNKQISRYADLKRSLIDEVITGKRAV